MNGFYLNVKLFSYNNPYCWLYYLVIKGLYMLNFCIAGKLTSASKKSTSFLRKTSICFSNSF